MLIPGDFSQLQPLSHSKVILSKKKVGKYKQYCFIELWALGVRMLNLSFIPLDCI